MTTKLRNVDHTTTRDDGTVFCLRQKPGQWDQQDLDLMLDDEVILTLTTHGDEACCFHEMNLTDGHDAVGIRSDHCVGLLPKAVRMLSSQFSKKELRFAQHVMLDHTPLCS